MAADINDGVVGSELERNSHLEAKLNRYYYTQDEQGSTVYITNKHENVRNEYCYDAFGNVLDSKEEVHNRITYTGQQFDSINQQYYLRARFYNPVVGRFTQEDVYRGDGLNLYAYCGNNPVFYYDWSGFAKSKCAPKNNPFEGMSNEEKGKRLADHKMKKQGYKKYPSKVGSNNGFDGVYIKFDKKGNVNHIVINESKFNTARLGEAKLGFDKPVKQMSDDWIKGNLGKMRKSDDKHVRKTAKLIDQYLEDENSIQKTLNRVRIPTKIKRPHTTNEWKNLGKYKVDKKKGK